MSRVFLPHVITDDSALGGMVIERSLRFRSSHYLSRTPSGAGSNQMTFSFWVKRAALGSSQTVFSSGETNARAHIYFGSDDKLNCQPFNSSGANTNLVVDRLIRDTISWYHIVLSFNNSAYNDTASTVNVYVNGVSASFTPSVTNTPTGGNRLNDSSGKRIGEMRPDSGNHLNGYLAEFNFIDGQVLDPSYFGFTDPQTGIWKPKRYEGTYGTNGFHLDFNDNSSVAALGIDKSPNGNDWSVSGVEIDLGTHDDSMIDTPTNNFPTLNPSNRSSGPTLDWGNLYFFYNYKPASKTCRTTFRLPKSGKYYWEWENNEASSNPGRWQSGIINAVNETSTNYDIQGYNDADIVSYSYGGSTWFGTTHTSGSWDGTTRSWYRPQRCAWAVDCDTGNVFLGRVADDATTQWWASDGSATGNPSKLLNPTGQIDKDITHHYLPFISWHDGGGASSTGFAIDVNFGQHAFKGTVPDGFKTLSSANIPPDPTINTIVRPQRHFETLLYTGNSTNNRAITGLGFSPDLVWIKRRSGGAQSHFWVSRGITISDSGGTGNVGPLATNDNYAQSATNTDGGFVSFDIDGFTLGKGSSTANADAPYQRNNADSGTYVAWCWKAGGAAVSNSDGSITSSVSANVEAGFSIVSWTGTGSDGTIGHGLGAVPSIYFVKRLNSAKDWYVQIGNLSGIDLGRFLKLNSNTTINFASDVFAASADTSTVLNTKGDTATNGSGDTYIAYCWTSIPGYSKFGSYTGNGDADGSYVELGFRPAWLMIKNTATSTWWFIYDVKRETYNPMYNIFGSNVADAEYYDNAYKIDILSNGFKARGTQPEINKNGETIIYMAFAEQPGATAFDTSPNAR